MSATAQRYMQGFVNRARQINQAANQPPPTDPGDTWSAEQLSQLNDPNGAFNQDYANREKTLAEQYAAARVGMGAQKDAASMEMARGIQRQIAAQGGAGGGAALKSIQKGNLGLSQGAQTAEAGLSEEQAAAQQALAGQKGQERLTREQQIEAGKQYRSSLGFQQSEAARAGAQFQSTLDENRRQFDSQLGYSYAELDENKKTNLINAMALMKSEGFLDRNFDELANLWRSGFGEMYKGVAPTPTEQYMKQAGGYFYKNPQWPGAYPEKTWQGWSRA